ncbi:response regulator [Geminocystis sp. GBBB08]|uniref:response regulator n=1 Tax=Geminocystis sp. GBBB08 TaxID=2604140 RepID=UPI0027E28F1A|nr:response regulator [Geminocystis sp. GBBB08]MBL1208811.1 response regulator [Geminocystis sp. GBBB08]
MNIKQIMIVEDSPIMRVILGNIISGDPHLMIVEYANDGKDALLKLTNVKPDLIILDLEMPNMDGITFLQNVKAKSNAKIMVITGALNNSPKINQAKMLGAQVVITKPSGVVSPDLKEKKGQEIKHTIYRILGI